MNILLLDAGNTRLKWAVLDLGPAVVADSELGRLSQFGACGYHADEVLEPLLAGYWSGLPDIGRVMMASVAGEAFALKLQRYCEQRWGLTPENLVTPASGGGVRNAYAEPQRLGIDRWLALVAARGISSGAVCVVDCGSAVTVDYLDAAGEHQGGLILPGLAMLFRSLSSGADNLADMVPGHAGDQSSKQVAHLAQDTAAAITGGVLTMLVAAIDRIVSEVVPMDAVVTCVITGGDGARLQPLLTGQWLYRPHLVLEGMAIMIEEKG